MSESESDLKYSNSAVNTRATLPAVARPLAESKELESNKKTFEELFSVQNLRDTWRAIRQEFKKHRVRDCVDWLDWSVSIERSLPEIRSMLLSGDYCPAAPSRYQLAKAKGAFRTMTVPNVRDALIYRIISDEALKIALPYKVKGAYFSRRFRATPVGRSFDEDDFYPNFFPIWLRYQQYRSTTLLNEPYEVVVVSDISNYFDSISHELLMEYLSPLGLPRKAVGLLGRILETFKPPAGHSPNPRIGIPTDEFDCSRELAHVFLFEHDQRIVSACGEDSFVRWMDDHTIGCRSKTEARQTVRRLTQSLSEQRLTLNAGKTKFLTTSQAVYHFQLEPNKRLDEWDKTHKEITKENIATAKIELEQIWGDLQSSQYAGTGQWDKVLKRIYGYVVRLNADFMDHRMFEDLVECPDLDQRIFLSLALRNKGIELLKLFADLCVNGESLYEATEAAFFEACLLLDPTPWVSKLLQEFACLFVEDKVKGQTKLPYGKASAVLLLYWYQLPIQGLSTLFGEQHLGQLPSAMARAWLAVCAAGGFDCLVDAQRRLVGHPSDDVARLSRFLSDLYAGSVEKVGNYKKQKWLWPKSGKYYDCRAWLQLELLSLSGSEKLRNRAQSNLPSFEKLTRTSAEQQTLMRIRHNLFGTIQPMQ